MSETHSRRAVLAGAGVTCAAFLAGCATYDANNGGIDGKAPAPTTAEPTAGGTASVKAVTNGTPVADVLATTAQVPEGGGTINNAKAVVITQPAAGTFKAFSAICTHQGCTVSSVSGGTINCPCHGSKFSVKDGSVVNGPAARPLPPVAIKVDGTSIVQG